MQQYSIDGYFDLPWLYCFGSTNESMNTYLFAKVLMKCTIQLFESSSNASFDLFTLETLNVMLLTDTHFHAINNAIILCYEFLSDALYNEF